MPEPGAGPGPNSAVLDDPPKQPPGSAKKADRDSLVMNQMKQQKQSSGMGADGSNPQVMAMMFLGMTQKGLQGLAASVPNMAPALMQISQQLGQAVPQGMADQLAGTDQTGAAVPPPPGGGAPSPPPPSAPPMGGGPPSMSGAPVESPTPAGVMM